MEYISAEQRAQLSQVFRTLAESSSGENQSLQANTLVISKEELSEAMDCIGVNATEDEVRNLTAGILWRH